MAGNRNMWLILGASAIFALGIVTAALIVTSDRDTASPPSATEAATATAEAAPSTSWPPPLPPGVPTTGEHAWRATWTPDPAAEQQYLSDVATSLDADYFAAKREQLVSFGYEICTDYYRGVPGDEEYDHIIKELVADPDYKPTLTDGGPYGNVRTATAAGDAVTIEIAANHQFCMNIDPWGEAY
jgi:hypothetical protein